MMDERSEKNLLGVHRDLYVIARLAAVICPIKFIVTEGLRTIERQKALVAAGASKTMKSRHLTGHAIDLAAMVDFDGDGDLDIRWDWPLYAKLADAMKQAAKTCELPIEWGGDWTTFKDGPHFQLPWKDYP